MSRGYIERRHCAVVVAPAKQPPDSEREPPSSRDCLLAAKHVAGPATSRRAGRQVGVSSSADERPVSRYGSGTDVGSSRPGLRASGEGSVKRSSSARDPPANGRDGSVLDYLGCRQVSVLPMDATTAKMAAPPTRKGTLSKAAGLSLGVPPPGDKKALESTDGNWVLKSEALAEAEKAKIRSLHARNMIVSNKLSKAKRAEESKRQNGGRSDPEPDRSPDASASPLHSPTARSGHPRQFHSLTARAYGGNRGVRVQSPQRPSILARNELGDLFLVPVLDSSPSGSQKPATSWTSPASSPSPGSVVYPRNEAYLFSVASPHSSSTPDLFRGAALSPYVATASSSGSHDVSSQTLPRRPNEPKHRVCSPNQHSGTDYVYSTMPRNTGANDDGKNIYRGAVVRVQVPGLTPKYLKHSQSMDAEYSVSRHAKYAERRSNSTGPELETTSTESGSQLKYIDAEVHIDAKPEGKMEKKHRKMRNQSTGSARNDSTNETSKKKANRVSRESSPRTVTLQKGRNGFGFVLRGAKSQNQAASTLDFKPTADFPALQYLDRVDHDSVADKAGLKAGDFVLEINGENVVNATHEHTVSLIKNSGDVLCMKVITVKPLTHDALDQRHIHADGTRTLPYKKKDGLDRTLAHYDAEPDRQSLGNASDSFVLNNVASLRGVDQQNKTASISRRIKRLSSTPLEGIFERQGGEDVSLDQSASHRPKPVVIGAQKVYASPQEARMKQNGGTSSSYSHHISHIDVLDEPDNQYGDFGPNVTNVHLSATTNHGNVYHAEPSSDGIYSVPYKHQQHGGLSVKISESKSMDAVLPPRPTRPPPQAPPISGGRNVTIPPPPSHAPPVTPHSTELGQVVPIQTHQHQYANVSEQIQMQRSGTDSDSSFESSFRPGSKAYVAKDPAPAPGQSSNHSRHSSGTSSLSSSPSNPGEHQLSNAGSVQGQGTALTETHHSTSADVYEPEPDYNTKETPPKRVEADVPSLRSLRDMMTGRDARSVDSSPSVIRSEKAPQAKSSPATPAVVRTQITASNTEQNSTKAPQQVTPPQKTKGPAPSPPTNQLNSSSTTRTAPTTPESKQEENDMSAFGNAIKKAALAREKRALEAEASKPKAPPPPPPVSSASIPPPPPGAPPVPPPPQSLSSVTAHHSPAADRKPVPAHIQKQLEDTRKHDESHAALLAAVAKRRNIVESVDRENLAESIESRIQRSKKLQTVVYKSNQSKPEVKVTTPPPAPVLAKHPGSETTAAEKNDYKTPENGHSQLNNNNDVQSSSDKSSTEHAPVTETKSNTDFLAAAEKARQEYLQKKQQATLERKTTKSPNATAIGSPKNDADDERSRKIPAKAGGGETKNQTTLSDLAHIIAEKALERQRSVGGLLENHNNNNAASAETSSNSSLTLSLDGSVNAVELHGATTDFSHTDAPLSSNNTSISGLTDEDDVLSLPVSARKRIFEAKQTVSSKPTPSTKDYHSNNNPVKGTNKTNLVHKEPASKTSVSGIHNGIELSNSGSAINGTSTEPGSTNTEFIPPPPLFDGHVVMDGKVNDDSVSTVSSLSTMSTLSSADHGDGPPQSFSFDVVPPPPPGFDDSPRTCTTDLVSSVELIPPPIEFDSQSPVLPVSGTLKNVQKSNQSHSISYPAIKSPPAGGQKGYHERNMAKWSTADVANWLESLQLSEHKDSFVKGNVTGEVLLGMDRNKLISLGVNQVGHRMAIERAIKKAVMQ